MHDVVERLLRYVQVYSTSDPHNETQTPSSARQHDMARLLEQELISLGCANVTRTDHAYVTATYPASAGAEAAEPLLLCAHIDTAPDAPGEGVKPHLVHYQGGPLTNAIVNGEPLITTLEDVPDLAKYVGDQLICTDGTTLLGADDKAGVAEICSLIHTLGQDPTLPHPTLIIAFVPDEEIGHGAALLDPAALGCRRGYTVDGEALGQFNYECFSAAEATFHITGHMVHPGSAYGIMVNALHIAADLANAIPQAERPATTRGYDGFYHLTELNGTASAATLSLIVRDFEDHSFEARQRFLQDLAARTNQALGYEAVTVSIRQQYHNMASVVREQAPELVEAARAAHEALGIPMEIVPVRGGTDGAQLSFRGLACPNLATGAYMMHSTREFVPVSALTKTVELLVKLVGLLVA